MLDAALVMNTLSLYQTLIELHRLLLQAKDNCLCLACSARLSWHVGNTGNAYALTSTVSRGKDLPP